MDHRSSQSSLPSSVGYARMPETQECAGPAIPAMSMAAETQTQTQTRSPTPFLATQPPPTQLSVESHYAPISPTLQILATQPSIQVPTLTMKAEEASSRYRDDTERDESRWGPEGGGGAAPSQLATQPSVQFITQPYYNPDGVEIEQLPIANGVDTNTNNDDYPIARDGSDAMEMSSIVEESYPSSVVRSISSEGSGARAIEIAGERISMEAETILGTMHPRDASAKTDIDDESRFVGDRGRCRVVDGAREMMNADGAVETGSHHATHENAKADEYNDLAMINQQPPTLADVNPIATTTNTEVDGVDAGEDNEIVDFPLQFDTAGVDAMDKDNGEHTKITTPHHRTYTVANPYARNSILASAKRPFDRISLDSTSSTLDNKGHKIVAIEDPAADSLPLNQVSNPYKMTKRTPRYSCSNEKETNTDIIHSHLPANSTKNSDHESLPSVTSAYSKLPSFRRAGISISLPMVERLPSRNVSYRPAEILSVGELYRYLYPNFTKQHQQGTQQDLESEAEARASNDVGSAHDIPQELTSVRITGTLLYVANSNPDRMGGQSGDLYSCGIFFLVGDPLENTRLLKKKSLTVQQVEQGTTDYNTDDAIKSKPGLTSILRSKSASTSITSAYMLKMQGATPDSATTRNENEHVSNALISSTKQMDQNGGAFENDTDTCKMMSRGIMNTNKKKRLVINGGGSRLSFGSLGSSSGRGGSNLGGQKFSTPKRVNLPVQASNVTNHLITRAGVPPVARGGIFPTINSTKYLKLEQIIQRHPSPIVPVWIGSSNDDDLLDGSVLGDLVMIMGEIVTEYCVDCHERNSKYGGADGVFNDENMDASLLAAESQHKDIEGDSHVAHSHEPITTTLLRGVYDAAKLIAKTALKVSGESLKCGCQRFLRARFVKNANGTDMSLQRESLRARRAYLAERKRLMANNGGLYSVGLGPPD
ncbi:hypothetical protein ACHAXA_009003 [Cyclostephanos tholiformis]|uniref:Uncharacterized protein n=1 Tax=Cyclostephanos tholiformis TaxID=382380 RepID=A0ABD3R7C8_9STRA